MADSQGTEADIEPTTVSPKTVDLGGDINLLVGPAGCQVRVRVSKVLFSLASKYSSNLFNNSPMQGDDVVLAEDEPDAIVNLCKILHMQYTAPKPMSPRELLHLGIVAEKYGCVKAIHLAVEALFPTATTNWTIDVWATRDLVVAAYLLEHPTMFSTYTGIIFASYSRSLAEVAISEMGQRVPIGAWLLLEARRSEILAALNNSIMALLRRPCTAEFRNCLKISDWYSKVTNALKTAGLMDIASSNTVSTLLYAAEHVVVPAVNSSLTQCGTVIQVPPPGQNHHPLPMTHAQFQASIRECRNKCRGITLDAARGAAKRQTSDAARVNDRTSMESRNVSGS